MLWQSKRQITTATSSSEAEYQALASSVKEAIWIKHLLVDMGLYSSPIPVLVDNSSTICWAQEVKVINRAKHIDVIHHYVQEIFADQRLLIQYVPTADQLADLLTKALGASLLHGFLPRIGMHLNG